MTLFPTYTSPPFGDLEAFAGENQQWYLFTYQVEAVLFGACEFFVCVIFFLMVVLFIPHFFSPPKIRSLFDPL